MRFLLGVFLAGAAFFVYGFLYWGMSPLPGKFVRSLGDEDPALIAAIDGAISQSGTYKYPNPPADMNDEAAAKVFEEKHNAGPVFMLHYHKGGAAPLAPKLFAAGFAHSLLVAFIGGLILLAASPRTYMTRVMLVFWTAVLVGVWNDIGNAIWWYYPWDFSLLEIGYKVGGGVVLGLILAAFIKSDPDMG